jgi:thymidylate synthase
MRAMKNQFDIQYQTIVKNILDHGCAEKNARTDHVCHSLPGQTIQIDLAAGFPLLTLRKIPLKVFVAEQIWFLMGEKELSFLQKFTKIWDDFAEKDNTIESAYGYRWRHHFGRDQIAGLIDLLENDATSRHGVVMMWDAADDGLSNGTAKKNVPCPFCFTVQIIGGKLCLHLVIRSNDMILGNPHDTAGFALLAYILAEKLKVPVGTMTVSISNAHVYGIHIEQAKTLTSREAQHESIPFVCPANAFDRALAGDETLVQEIFEQLKASYEPHESLGRMKIVL